MLSTEYIVRTYVQSDDAGSWFSGTHFQAHSQSASSTDPTSHVDQATHVVHVREQSQVYSLSMIATGQNRPSIIGWRVSRLIASVTPHRSQSILCRSESCIPGIVRKSTPGPVRKKSASRCGLCCCLVFSYLELAQKARRLLHAPSLTTQQPGSNERIVLTYSHCPLVKANRRVRSLGKAATAGS